MNFFVYEEGCPLRDILLFTLNFKFCPDSLNTTPETQGSFN